MGKLLENYKYRSVQLIENKMNEFGKAKCPFLFIINFDATDAIIIPSEEIEQDEIKFNFENIGNSAGDEPKSIFPEINISPISEEAYKDAFDKVIFHLKYGDSYLLNLTFPTPLQSNLSLEEIYQIAESKYKLYLKDKFVCFSPETFVRIENNDISSYPMKGTISADLPDAKEILLNNSKEIAEHNTIVDLLRNDLSIVSKNVRVVNYRFFDKIATHRGNIFQTSSKISGKLPNDWHRNIGTIIMKMLPAGSVTGAPKLKTLEIIHKVENYNRGFYTGVAGIFDGDSLNSCVLIRFLEQTQEGLQFKSGGGITANSDWKSEYMELLEKIYVPVI